MYELLPRMRFVAEFREERVAVETPCPTLRGH
jgi:hypothetical protein